MILKKNISFLQYEKFEQFLYDLNIKIFGRFNIIFALNAFGFYTIRF